MTERSVDVVLIGMGPGGEDLGGRLASSGLSVVGIERDLLGGECPYFGCVPSKMFIRAAELLQDVRRANKLAGTATVTPNFTLVADRIRTEATHDWNDSDAVERFTAKGGIFVRGEAALAGPDRVVVNGDIYVARRGVVLSTGTSPELPPVQGLATVRPWTNRDVFKIRVLPDSLTIIGGGAIAVELAQAFARFGTSVTIIETAERLVRAEEPEAGLMLIDVLRSEGVVVYCGAEAESVTRHLGKVTTTLKNGPQIVSQEILVAAGRRPNVTGIGLQTVGLDESDPLRTDEHMRVVGAPKLWAIGDITGHGAYTHMSVYQASIAGDDILGVAKPRRSEYHAVPRVTFTDPEIGSVGLSEAKAREAKINVGIGFVDCAEENRNWIYGEGREGFLKLVADLDTNVLIGATSVGPRGGDVLSMFNLAVHARTPLAELRTMICAFPTFYRAATAAIDALPLNS